MNGQAQAEPQIQYHPAGVDPTTGWPQFFCTPERSVWILAPEQVVKKGVDALTAKQVEKMDDPEKARAVKNWKEQSATIEDVTPPEAAPPEAEGTSTTAHPPDRRAPRRKSSARSSDS